nr:MAG TPA: hypothetical protein [Caudoviricetes sp.]
MLFTISSTCSFRVFIILCFNVYTSFLNHIANI